MFGVFNSESEDVGHYSQDMVNRTIELVDAFSQQLTRCGYRTNQYFKDLPYVSLTSNVKIEQRLNAAIVSKQEYCKKKNHRFRSAHILLALITLRSFTFETLNRFSFEKTQRLKKRLETFMFSPQDDSGYIEHSLDDDAIVIYAKKLAKQNGLLEVDERMMLLAFLTTETSTLSQFRKLWDSDFDLIVGFVKTLRTDTATPLFM